MTEEEFATTQKQAIEDACRCLYETIHSFHELVGIRAWMERASLTIRRLLIKLKYADELADILEGILNGKRTLIDQTKGSLQNYRDASDFPGETKTMDILIGLIIVILMYNFCCNDSITRRRGHGYKPTKPLGKHIPPPKEGAAF